MGRLIDLTDKKFGRLTVISRKQDGNYINGEALWECLCSCDKKSIVYVHGSQLRSGGKKSCGCIRKPSDLEYLKKIQVRLVENSRLNIGSQCIEWTGFKDKGGYGNLCISKNGKEMAMGAHRASWLVYQGEIPSGMFVCHKCDNPACIHIRHLFLGTHEDNMRDKIRKGRANIARGIHAGRAKLRNKDVKEILSLKGKGISSHEICKKYNVAASTIRQIWQRRAWKHIHIKD